MVIVKTVAVANKARSVNKDMDADINRGIAVAVAENYLNNALMALTISLLAQDTSQLLLYKSPVMHYLAIRGINP